MRPSALEPRADKDSLAAEGVSYTVFRRGGVIPDSRTLPPRLEDHRGAHRNAF